MKKVFLLTCFLCLAFLGFSQVADSAITMADNLPKLSLREQFGIERYSFPALIIANLLIIFGFYGPILYNYSIRGVVQPTFLQKKQLLAMNLFMLVTSSILVLVPEAKGLFAYFGLNFDIENSKILFILLGLLLYGAKLQGKIFKEFKEIKKINENLQDKAEKENVG